LRISPIAGDSTNLQEAVPAYDFEKQSRVNAITLTIWNNVEGFADSEFRRAGAYEVPEPS